MHYFWDIKKIRDILPQDRPFIFIDGVLDTDIKKKQVTCAKNVTINEDFFSGHFPSNPIMPGVLIIEALAQASIILYAVVKPEKAGLHPDYYLGKVEAKFSKPVTVGSRLILKVTGEKVLDRGGIVSAKALVDDEVVAAARISFGVKLPDKK